MTITFYVSAIIAVLATLMVITQKNAVHALLYLIVSLLSVAIIFYTLGAPFVAALEVIIYAGAIMVLFLFVIMMLNVTQETIDQENRWLELSGWWGPALLTTILIAELIYIMVGVGQPVGVPISQSPKQVGITLFGPYLLGVELASMLLLAGLVGAYHLGQRHKDEQRGGN
jgi:NADH-quinone oxidoreductase subunit J